MLFKKKRLESKFNNWIKQHHAALYRHALWMTGNRDVAADMVQEAYYKAWLAVETLDDEQKILPWLLTILRRVVYREQRYQYRHQATVEQFQQQDEAEAALPEYTLLDLYRSFDSISNDQREAFLLSALHGFTYEEISEQLEIPMGTVMSRVARAKSALRSLHKSTTGKVINLQEIKRGKK